MNELSGLSAFTLTPFDKNGIVDVNHLQKLIASLAATDVDSIGVLGSTGSYMYLDQDQRARAIEAAVEAGGGTSILAGIGDLRTDRVLAHVRNAEAAGADALLLAPVSYLPLTDRDFTGLVESVSMASRLPVCLYNNPGTTHFSMSAALVEDLANLPNVTAVKNPAPVESLSTADIDAMRQRLPDDFVLGYSGDAKINHVLPAGADAWYSVIGGTLPQLALNIWSARRDADALRAIHQHCAPLWDCFNTWGGIRVVPEIARLTGLGSVNLALPLQPLDVAAVGQIERALEVVESTCC